MALEFLKRLRSWCQNGSEGKGPREFLGFLRENFGERLNTVYLFGSYARKEHDEESDVDMLVIGELNPDDLIDEIFKILMKYGVVLDVIVEKPEDFEKWKNTSFHRTVRMEGIQVY